MPRAYIADSNLPWTPPGGVYAAFGKA